MQDTHRDQVSTGKRDKTLGYQLDTREEVPTFKQITKNTAEGFKAWADF